MSSKYWLNLALAGLVTFYLIIIGWQVAQRMICGEIAADFCGYWSAGKVARLYGFGRIYDLQYLGPVANSVLPGVTVPSQVAILPATPYLAVFLLPFYLLSLLSPELAYWVWTLFSLLALFLYVRFFVRRLQLGSLPARVMIMLFAALPVFTTTFLGQMEVWLVVCSGELLRALLDGKPFRAGLWLGGLLLKPQLVIVFGLILLLQRSVRILAGLATAASSLLLATFLLVGPAGFVQMLDVWLAYGNNSVGSWVGTMMNWRMLGSHLSAFFAPWFGWGLAGAGMLVTLLVVLYLWRERFDRVSPGLPVAFLGVLAGSAMLAWYAHIHTAVIFLPPIIYLYQKQLLPQELLNYWVFVPSGLYVAMMFLPESLIALGMPFSSVTPVIYFGIGVGEFSANMALFLWAARRSLKLRLSAPSAELAP